METDLQTQNAESEFAQNIEMLAVIAKKYYKAEDENKIGEYIPGKL